MNGPFVDLSGGRKCQRRPSMEDLVSQCNQTGQVQWGILGEEMKSRVRLVKVTFVAVFDK